MINFYIDVLERGKMEMKVRHKNLLLVSVLLVSIVLFNTSVILATEVVESTINEVEIVEETVLETQKKLLEVIPDDITLDILESQIFEKNEEGKLKNEILLEEQISKVLKENNIEAKLITNNLSENSYNKGIINKCTISVDGEEKEITVKYKNSEDYNEIDAKYVEEKVKNIDLDLIVPAQDNYKEYEKIAYENAKKVINDNSLTILIESVASGIGGSIYVEGYNVYVYKNNVLYAVKDFRIVGMDTIIIPEEIADTDDAYIDYACKKLQEEWKDTTIKSIVKWDKEIDYLNLESDGTFYKVTTTEEEGLNEYYISLKKEKISKVMDNVVIDNNTDVKITGENIEKENNTYSEMSKKLKAKGYSDVLAAFELKITSGQIKDNVTITFNLGTENNGKKAMVLHKKADGSYEEFIKVIKDGKVEITVKELSPFMIAISNETDNRVLDDEPKTGVVDYTIIASVIALISLSGIVVIKIKNN